MARAIFTNGNTMVSVNGSELGLSEQPISISFTFHHLDVLVETYGGHTGPPFEIQAFPAEAHISMVLVHFDRAVLDTCIINSIGGTAIGVMPVGGTLMGGSSKFLSLNLSSPTGGKPWTFPSAYLAQNPITFPIGNERSLLQLTWRAIPYLADPATAAGAVLFTNEEARSVARGIYIQGASMVSVDGTELGVAEKQIELRPRFFHDDIRADDFGDKAPAEVMWMLADFIIDMTLVHFDNSYLYTIVKKSMGGAAADTLGTFKGAGTMMASSYMSLSIATVTLTGANGNTWTFPKAYLSESPFVWPIGNERSLVQLRWRAVGVPAVTAGEVLSTGASLFS